MKKAIIFIIISLIISLLLILFANSSFYELSSPGLKITKDFFSNIENSNFEKAKEQVDYILKERVNNFRIAKDKFNQEIIYKNEKFRVLEEGEDYVVVRVNYDLIKRSDYHNVKKPVTMDVYLKLVSTYKENRKQKELKIVYLKSV